MINQTDIANGVPILSEDERRISERKDVRCEVWMSTKNYLEVGVMFLTTRRVIFVCSEPQDMISFECRLESMKDLGYSKKGDYRNFEGIVLGSDTINFCRFKFSYNQTGFRSIISLIFSLHQQIQFPILKNQ